MTMIKKMITCILVMGVTSLVSLIVLSVLSYVYKWQADKALIGITIIYILAGFFGGIGLKQQNRKNGMSEELSIGKKMQEAIFLGTVFMLVLILLSVFMVRNPFLISRRMIMTWMLITGSACLGRIL